MFCNLFCWFSSPPRPGSVQATVNNIFEDTTITQESITQAIKDAIANPSNELLSNAEYTSNATMLIMNTQATLFHRKGLFHFHLFYIFSVLDTNLCEQEPLPCDVSSTMCTNSNGNAVCSCKQGYISILYSNTSCRGTLPVHIFVPKLVLHLNKHTKTCSGIVFYIKEM